MTVDEAIKRLEELRGVVGGDVPFCIRRERTDSGSVEVLELATIEICSVVRVGLGNRAHWVSLMSGNTSEVVKCF